MAAQPYVAKLPDGRYVAVELPDGSTTQDPTTGELLLRPAALHLLDQIRTLVCPLPPKMTANRLRILREGLGLTQEQLAKHLNCQRQDVDGWENGVAKPEINQIGLLENLRKEAIARGILLPQRNL